MAAILFDNLSCQYPNQPSSSHRQEQSRDLKKVPRIENCWTEQVFKIIVTHAQRIVCNIEYRGRFTHVHDKNFPMDIFVIYGL